MKIIYLPLRLSLLILHVIFGLIILIFYPANNIGLKRIHHNISLYWMKILVMIFGLKIIQKGNIDTLANRISNVRTWSYVANKKNWANNSDYWVERTKYIEDRLSD